MVSNKMEGGGEGIRERQREGGGDR